MLSPSLESRRRSSARADIWSDPGERIAAGSPISRVAHRWQAETVALTIALEYFSRQTWFGGVDRTFVGSRKGRLDQSHLVRKHGGGRPHWCKPVGQAGVLPCNLVDD